MFGGLWAVDWVEWVRVVRKWGKSLKNYFLFQKGMCSDNEVINKNQVKATSTFWQKFRFLSNHLNLSTFHKYTFHLFGKLSYEKLYLNLSPILEKIFDKYEKITIY